LERQALLVPVRELLEREVQEVLLVRAVVVVMAVMVVTQRRAAVVAMAVLVELEV